MTQDFYELLKISPNATQDEIKEAYGQRIGHLVRRLKAAEERGADTAALEIQERDLRFAKETLADPKRRRSYNVFRSLMTQGIPDDMQKLWAVAKPAIVDPRIYAAIRGLDKFTKLPLGNIDLLNTNFDLAPEEIETAPKIENIPPMKPLSDKLKKPRVEKKRKEAKAKREKASTEDAPTEVVKSRPKTSARIRNTAQKKKRVEKSERGALTPGQLDALAARIGYDGRFIRTVRERRGLSIEDLSSSTRISINFLKAIEMNAYDQLPSPTFVKGYINNIARTLGIDDRPVVQGYMHLFRNKR